MDQETVSLIRQAQSGDVDAFHRLVMLYDQRVMSLAFRLLRNEQDAEDLYQEVFMKVFTNIRKFRFESDFFTWLYRITVNSAFNVRKRLRYHHRMDTDGESEPNFLASLPDSKSSRQENAGEIHRAVTRAVETLPQKQRTVFILKHLESMKIKDIASLLDCTEGTVKKYLFRAAEKLRKELQEYRYA